VAVPTHFAKVILATKPASPSTPEVLEVSQGAFVLPNAIIPDEAPLESFIMPVEAVEKAAGLTLLPDGIKTSAKHICQTARCQVVVRRFDEARKRGDNKRSLTSPK
jgi:endonuclease G